MRRASLTPIALGMLLPSVGNAYHYTTCNNHAYRWAGGSTDVALMSCSAPAGSEKADDLIYGFEEWNAVQSMRDVFDWSYGNSACAVNTGNGRSEVGFVTREAIDGALGLTLRRYSGGCWAWSRQIDIIEADVFINGDANLEAGNPEECNQKRLGQRTTIMHELGHALGLNHDDEHMALMMSTDGEGKYCGNRMIEPHPDDATGGRRLYGQAGESRDLAASEFKVVAADRVALNSQPNNTETLCPGSRHTVDWSVANLGTVDETYNVRWYLSENRRITDLDHPIATNLGAIQNAGHFSTWRRQLTIPQDVPPGLYFLGHLVDYDERIWERRGDNNYTYMASRIRVLDATDPRCLR